MAIEPPVISAGAPDTSVWEASLLSAAGAFSQKAFLQRFETDENLEEKLAKLEFAEGKRAFDEQAALETEPLDNRLVLMSPFVPADVRLLVQDLNLEAVEQKAMLYQRRHCQSPEKFSEEGLLEVSDEKPWGKLGPAPHRAQGLASSTPTIGCCSVPTCSALCALLLRPEPGEKVLDMCGSAVKAAVLACYLFSKDEACSSWLQSVGHESGVLGSSRTENSVLVCNVPDRTCAQHLELLLGNILPAEVPVLNSMRTGASGHVLLSSVEAWQKQALLPLQRLGPFDRIIVDPSCTGGFGTRLPDLKYPELAEALLCNAAKLLRPGGLLLYCTARVEDRCTDAVVRGFLRNSKLDFEVLPPDLQLDVAAVPSESGQLVAVGRKPKQSKLYLSRLRRSA